MDFLLSLNIEDSKKNKKYRGKAKVVAAGCGTYLNAALTI